MVCVEDEGGVTLDDLLVLWWWRTVEEYGPMRRSQSSVGVIDIMVDASCDTSVKVMICGK